MDNPTLNPALKPFWLAKARNRVLYGGRSSSKSWDAAGFVIFLAQHLKIRVLCTRQFQNKIEESVYTLLKIQIERFGLQSVFRVLDNKIICNTTGSEFLFYGLWRQIDEVKSLESVDIHWAEEAHYLTASQWEILDPTIRKEGSQHWIIFNPRFSSDFVYQKFVVNPPANTIVRKINYDENPFLSKTMRDVIESARLEDPEEFAHIYLGEPRTNEDSAIIKRSHVMAAIGAHLKLGIEPLGRKVVSFDVADSGKDSCAMIYSHGSLACWSQLWKAKEDELMKSCKMVWNEARERNAFVIYDAIGVGAFAGSKFDELNVGQAVSVSHSKFFAGGSVLDPDQEYGYTGIKNKDYFSNIKSQAWWKVAERFKNTYNAVNFGEVFDVSEMVFIDENIPNLQKLIDELCTPMRDFDQAGRVKVESKKDLDKREIASPNLADAFIMNFAPMDALAIWEQLG